MIKNDSSDKECDRQKFFSFWDIFCLFTPLTTHKIKTFKKYPPLPPPTPPWRYHFTQVHQKS